MRNETIGGDAPSSAAYEGLEAFVRQKVQGFIQEVLEEEVTALLGRWQRRRGVDEVPGYRNGYGRLRKLSLTSGTVEVRRPRVRGLEERFESRILPLFKRRTREVGELLPQLYLHGLAEGDFDLALRGLLGEGAPLSASSIARLKAGWLAEYEAFKKRSLLDSEIVYLWVDGVYVKAGLEKEKAALLVAIGGVRDGRKLVLAVEPGYRESKQSWAGMLRGLKERGMNCPSVVVGDGHLGIWGALAEVFPKAKEQRCWNHRIVNVLDKLPKSRQAEGKLLLTAIPYAQTRAEVERLKGRFQDWCKGKGFEGAAELIEYDWERMVTFYDFPKAHWKHLRTTNIIESPFAAVRLRTAAAKRYKKVANATAVIWKTLMVAESRFRRLDAPHLVAEVAEGAVFVDGERFLKSRREKVAA